MVIASENNYKTIPTILATRNLMAFLINSTNLRSLVLGESWNVIAHNQSNTPNECSVEEHNDKSSAINISYY